jgi:hypothetical protein
MLSAIQYYQSQIIKNFWLNLPLQLLEAEGKAGLGLRGLFVFAVALEQKKL